ncbi:TIGR04086 family membrane protein [Haloplasma contractile]|uniref:TIGR04086 family membrane protein n=1 Tax=Haloplasma contractile SSD-17B TaxID=1033810 RepID=U2FNQ4_9MOLU|nr:TIGR04086 family membrane protein [Haloplasma contractile]ERJ12749.1 hypothetical protein HLPCO_001089 [Haloplasma contractile SSD-17B]
MKNKFRTSLKILFVWFVISLGIILCATLLANFGVISIQAGTITIFIIALLIFFILGFLTGNGLEKNGLFNSLILSFIVMILLLMLWFLGFNQVINFKLILRFVILMLTSGLGGVIGVNFKPIIK